MQLTFNTEQKANDGQREIWINYIRAKFAEDKEMVGTGTEEFQTLDDLTDDQIAALKIYGYKDGTICKTHGVTLQYAQPTKAYELTLWFFTKPADALMTNVIDYTEQPLNPAWFPPAD
jgi:hypothetical protein